jgi:N-acetylglucosaminyldiphosphoundecaprenol N-acetyl-beta-D-mannosaminyltransferase
MFHDHPVFGVGFGRFYDRKLPYLSDRSQEFELDSIRPLNHHNTLLSVLTEMGLVGLAAFVGLFAVWARAAWSLVRDSRSTLWIRSQGILLLALMVNYLCSAMFHDLTLIPSQELLLMAFAGVTINLRQQAASPAAARRERPDCSIAPHAGQIRGNGRHVGLFGMKISNLTLQQASEQVLRWCAEPRGSSCRFVVTPNVDHAVLFQRHSELRAAYDDASLVLADGAPIVAASRLFGRPLPERVAGSDLVPNVFESARTPLKVFLLGAGPGVAEAAAANISRRWANVELVGYYSPPSGFENNLSENNRILAMLAASNADLLIIGLGAPKQELWAHRQRHLIAAKVALCAGATIDFLAGHRRRSPVWMRRAGLEWLHRVWCEPRRLAGRYARDAWVLPQLLWCEWRQLSTSWMTPDAKR